MSREIPDDTLEFIYNHIREAPQHQQRTREGLDTKMVQIFGAASIVIGLAGVSSRELDGGDAVDILLVGAVVAYVASAFTAFFHLRVRKFRLSLQAHALWRNYWLSEPKDVKHALVQDISEAYEHNKRLLDQKAETIVVGLVATGLEVALVGAALIWSRLA